MKALTGIFALALVATPAVAGDLNLSIQAVVPVMCSVTGVQAVDVAAGTVRVDASCNAERFVVQFGGELAALPIQSATGTGGAVTVAPDGIQVHANRPGQFTFVVDYDQDLSSVTSATVNLTAL